MQGGMEPMFLPSIYGSEQSENYQSFGGSIITLSVWMQDVFDSSQIGLSVFDAIFLPYHQALPQHAV